jgi:membrane peptidoglycan carboxypeptidase
VLLTGVVVASLLASHLTGDLPADAALLFSQSSPQPSSLLAADGTKITQFQLIEAIEPAQGVPPELMEAFLFAAEPSFYEARATRATPLSEALVRAAAGSAPSASRLSTELARLILEDEPAGLRRRVREEILASRLDAHRSAAERALTWLEWVPLCDGHRGLERAGSHCLGVPVESWGPAEVAAVAAAAVGGVDLSEPPDLRMARRDAVIDRLVLQGGLDPEQAVQLPAPAPRVSAPGADAWQREILAEIRRRGGHLEPEPVVVTSFLDRGIQGRIEALAPKGAWAAVDPRSGGILAFGGSAELPGSALERAGRAAALIAPDGVVFVRHVAVVELPGGSVPELDPVPAVRDGRSAVDRLRALQQWEEAPPMLRRIDPDGCVTVVHPRLALTVCGGPSADAVAALGAGLPPETPPIPDELWQEEDGRLVRRAGVLLPPG